MVRSLSIGVGLLSALLVLAVVLLFTVGRDRVEDYLGERLLRAAVGDEQLALLSLVPDLAQRQREHPAFACAAKGEWLGSAVGPAQLAAAAGLLGGEWEVAERGALAGELAYVIVVDASGSPASAGRFDWREFSIDQGSATCVVPA